MIFANILIDDRERICLIKRESNSFICFEDPSMTMLDLIENFETYQEEIQEKYTGVFPDSLDFAKILTPIPYPKRNVVCLGKNYLDHIKEIHGITGGPTDTAPAYPIYFTKAAFPCIGPGEIILRHPHVTSQIDYEAELCVVIGKAGMNISREKAEDHIFGYTIGNDISARDVQNRHVNWFKGKSLHTHCAIGPFIIHKSLLPLPLSLNVQSYVNGEQRQNGNTADLIWDIPSIISDLSQGYTLQPGDFIMTGTPKGVGMGFDPPKYLNPGDQITCKIEGIGELTNYVESLST